MKVLLINPNRFHSPPVPPIALEYVAGAMEDMGHEIRLLDLCFASDPRTELIAAIDSFMPDIAGVTVRNVDSVLFHNHEFYLDEIKSFIDMLKAQGVTVLIGGAGVMADPQAILSYVGADYAFSGHAETILKTGMAALADSPSGTVFSSRNLPFAPCSRRYDLTDYRTYFQRGGIAGFETHKGCSSSCVYCLEAGTPVFFRDVPEIIEELRHFVSMGITRFHLCDPEFNENLEFSIDFLLALVQQNLPMQWALYMKPAEYNRKLFQLMKKCGVSLITLTVDSFRKCPLYWQDIEKIVFIGRNAGIPVFIDFLCGFPSGEDEDIRWFLDYFRRIQPDRVNINSHIRLYRPLRITSIVLADEEAQRRTIGLEGSDFLKPVFYNQLSDEQILKLIDGDPLFRIEGTGNGVNYSRSGLLKGIDT